MERMNFLLGRGRYRLYASALALLLLVCVGGSWSAAGTGAYLTDEGDWQYLAGDYRIGTIDYLVSVNDQLLMGLEQDTSVVATHRLAVPIRGGVRIFDSTAETAGLRDREFNEGATLMRVRIVNRSDSMVVVSASFSLLDQSPERSLRVLPLPVELDDATARRLDYRQYVLDTLGLDESALPAAEDEALSALDAAYAGYLSAHPSMDLDAGLIPGALTASEGDDCVIEDGRPYYYKDVFLLVWSEYSGDYDTQGAAAPVLQGQFECAFTVGRLD